MRRKWIVAAVIAFAVVLAVIVFVRAAFTPEKLRALVEPRLEAAVARLVELENIRLTWLPPAVRVRQAAGAGGTRLLDGG